MKKKGFTLIELLAVIVILAIIALIATPLVLKYIETSRIESFKVSVENIKDSALKYVASEQLNGKVTYPVIVDVQDLDFKGKEDYTGILTVYKNGTIEEYIEKGNYRTSDGTFIVGNTTPYLVFKEGYSGIIDENNKFVYSFLEDSNFDIRYFTIDVLNNIFDCKNCNLNFVKNERETYSTGSKIQLLDENNNILKEYEIVIFADVSGEGRITTQDITVLNTHVNEVKNGNIGTLSGAYLKAGDINHDGIIDDNDVHELTLSRTSLKQKFFVKD